jgi:Domain of unknown function (DUF4410)
LVPVSGLYFLIPDMSHMYVLSTCPAKLLRLKDDRKRMAMKQMHNPRLAKKYLLPSLTAAMLTCIMPTIASAEGPLAAKINVTTLQSYSGGDPLPKPTKILVYDFAIDTSKVQADKSQEIRPRHMLTGDENPEAVAKRASAKFSTELIAKLMKTGIPVEHAAADAAVTDNTLSVQGAFTSLRQGDKAERATVGMGTGSADVQAKVDVQLKTPASAPVLLSEFQTDTKPAENMGAAIPAAAGLDPAAVAVKAKVGDRKKTLEAYASKTADAMAAEITKQMAKQGWIKLNDKGEVVP